MMLKMLTTLSILTMLIVNFSLPSLVVHSQEPTAPSASDSSDIISETVKRRIQEAVKDRPLQTPALQNHAYMGTLQSLTNNTLSILTDTGVKLASTSSETQSIKLPGSKKINLSDLPLDSFLIAIGPSDAEDVVSAVKVITQDNPPEVPTNKAAFGTITAYDTKNYLLTINDPQTNQPLTVLLGRKTIINQWVDDGTKNALKRTQSFDLNTPCLVIYTPAPDETEDNLALEVLIKNTN